MTNDCFSVFQKIKITRQRLCTVGKIASIFLVIYWAEHATHPSGTNKCLCALKY